MVESLPNHWASNGTLQYSPATQSVSNDLKLLAAITRCPLYTFFIPSNINHCDKSWPKVYLTYMAPWAFINIYTTLGHYFGF